ncbi:unnamed protein product [Schistocephalus solidus]|uniref:Reverse transcriptase domain-containing protein n=1 Tax=Schistocephalus solidus TaxID=70667 RepID=A0A183T3Z9_SCHSO|nr:unnamed protein product [Schistocephalus solidus]
MQNARMNFKTEKIEGYTDRNETKYLFASIPAVCCPCIKGTAPMPKQDKGKSTIHNKCGLALICKEIMLRIKVSEKAPGFDAIPVEVYIPGGPRFMVEFTVIFQEIWCQAKCPQFFKDATIVQLHNSDRQCGVRRNCRTADVFFAARQLQKKCHEMQTHLCTTLVNLMKAFDTVNRDGLRKLMYKAGCTERFTQRVARTDELSRSVSPYTRVGQLADSDRVLVPGFGRQLTITAHIPQHKRPGVPEFITVL